MVTILKRQQGKKRKLRKINTSGPIKIKKKQLSLIHYVLFKMLEPERNYNPIKIFKPIYQNCGESPSPSVRLYNNI